MLMFLFVSMGSIALIAYLGYSTGRSSLNQTITNNLISIRAAKAHEIETYFQTVRAQARTLSGNLMVVEAMESFANTFPALTTQTLSPEQTASLRRFYQEEFLPRLTANVEGTPSLGAYAALPTSTSYLQYHYIVNNTNPIGQKERLNNANDDSDYSQTHSNYHPHFRQIVNELGYYDMFLIDAATGNIIYSVYKEVDYGTNLYVGPYANSKLADAFKIALESEPGVVTLTDFGTYRPSYGQPAAFLASPIYSNSGLVGVLAFQVSTDKINRIMTINQDWNQVGLQQTGETYLVGADYRLRSDARLLLEDPQTYLTLFKEDTASEVAQPDIAIEQTLNTSILQHEARSPGLIQALEAGISGIEIARGYQGNTVLRAYDALDIQDIDWAIVSEISRAEAFAPVEQFSRQVLISMAVIVLTVTLLSVWLTNRFLKPIRLLNQGFQKLSDGNINAHVNITSRDEFGELGKSFNAMIRALKKSTHEVEKKNHENEALLQNILPSTVARRLQNGERNIADHFPNVTVLFCKFIGCQDLVQKLPPEEAIALLNEIVTAFDDAVERHGVEKVKTNGSEYMAVGGLSIPCLDHAKRLVDCAVDMLRLLNQINRDHGLEIQCRIGIHSGEVMAGIVGQHKFTYDLWGETVNIAYGLQMQGQWNTVCVTQPVRERLMDIYECEEAGTIQIQQQPISMWAVKI